MGKGGKGKGGGYPWWEHIKSKGGGKGKGGGDDGPAAKQIKYSAPKTQLEKYASDLDGRQYPCYKDLKGDWKENDHTIFVDHVQGDAYAAPSSVRVRIPQSRAKIPDQYVEDKTKNRACTDFCTRVLSDLLRGGSGTDWTKAAPKSAGWGSSKGGDIQVDLPSQMVLWRSALVLTKDYIEARCTIGLPAHGRTIEGSKCASAFAAMLEACEKAMLFSNLDKNELEKHTFCVEDQVHLREVVLKQHGLVAFVGNNALLPRRSGTDDRPMDGSDVVRFQSPPSLEVEITLPNKGKVRGMGIRKGITMIVGGGFHGKSTLLQALQFGVYDKVRGDGRELVSAEVDCCKIRSEDGRSVVNTDISPFIKNLPFKTDTTSFSTKDASGSTSQAANIVESLEAGATTLLVDEDTCATNFMIRDHRMQMLVAKNKEPITPFIHKITPLYTDRGVSTILVVGGSGDFFEVADTVVCMENYLPQDVTKEAKEIVKKTAGAFEHGGDDKMEVENENGSFPAIRKRTLKVGNNGLSPDGKTFARNLRCIAYGEEEVELTFIEQLVELSQAKALCALLEYLGNGSHEKIFSPTGQNGGYDFAFLLKQLEGHLNDTGKKASGLDNLSWSNPSGFYAMPRRLEMAAVINRVRSLKMN